MKTTINIPEKLLSDAIRIAGAKTKRDAVVRALEEFTRRNRVEEIIATFGTWDMLSNDEIEAADIEEAKRNAR